jgi:hypothetical protein
MAICNRGFSKRTLVKAHLLAFRLLEEKNYLRLLVLAPAARKIARNAAAARQPDLLLRLYP